MQLHQLIVFLVINILLLNAQIQSPEFNVPLHIDNITKINVQLKSARLTHVQYTQGTAPIAPLESGGAYVLYAEPTSFALKVLHVDEDLNTVKIIDLETIGIPCDITAAPFGLVVLFVNKTNTKQMIIATYTTNGFKTNQRTVLNSIDFNPSYDNATAELRDQISFYNDDYLPVAGNEYMYLPFGGRVSYGDGRIALVFQHFNNFGNATVRDDRIVDTFLTLNNFLLDAKLCYGVGSSYCLTDRLLFDGERFFTVSLGDSNPDNFYFHATDGSSTNFYDPRTKAFNRLNYIDNPALIVGNVPGTEGVGSSGRLGGIMKLSENKYAMVYSRIPAGMNELNEIAMVTFTQNLQRLNYFPVLNNRNASCLKSAKYGSNVVIAFSIPATSNGQYLPSSVSDNDQMYIMLVDPNGTVISPEINMTEYGLTTMNGPDDFVVLNDGSVVWSYVNSTNDLHLVRIKAPYVPVTTTSSSTTSTTSSSSSTTESGNSTTGSTTSTSSTSSSVSSTTTTTSSSQSNTDTTQSNSTWVKAFFGFLLLFVCLL